MQEETTRSGRLFPDRQTFSEVRVTEPDKNRPLQVAFQSHPRQWRTFTYIYPVISRRSRGLSIGINLNPDKACNFDCVYCCVDRTVPPTVRKVDLDRLRAELDALVGNWRALFDEPEFQQIPDHYRRLNDLAFSGDGEPTAAPTFPDAADLAIAARQRYAEPETKIVIITDACFLTRPKVAATLARLDRHNGEIWAKLDAGTEEYFQQVARASHSLDHVLENIRAAGQHRDLVIQSLFLRLHDAPPPESELDAYAQRLAELQAAGTRIKLAQIYTVARQTAETFVAPLTAAELESIADRVRARNIPAEVYP